MITSPGKISTARHALERFRDEPVLVAYSGGKDSLVALDLAQRAGCQVECYIMSFLPGMDYTREWSEYAERRFKIHVHEIQHFIVAYYLRRGIFCESSAVPSVGIVDVEASIRARTGRRWLLYGYKPIDSLQRRGMLSKDYGGCGVNEKANKVAPIGSTGHSKAERHAIEWNNSDVAAYLQHRAIKQPLLSARRSAGINLTPECLAFLKIHYPRDYCTILNVFPYAEAQHVRHKEAARNARNRALPGVDGGLQPAHDYFTGAQEAAQESGEVRAR